MVHVTISNDERGHFIACNDHATGSDQVCAAVSSLIYALGGWVKNYIQEDRRNIHLEGGCAFIQVLTNGPEVTVAFSVAIIGLLQLAKAYPDYISVKAVG